jgi:hypothetical protein
MGRFVSATGQFLLATNGQLSWPPVGNFRWPSTEELADLEQRAILTAAVSELLVLGLFNFKGAVVISLS